MLVRSIRLLFRSQATACRKHYIWDERQRQPLQRRLRSLERGELFALKKCAVLDLALQFKFDFTFGLPHFGFGISAVGLRAGQ